MRKYWVNVPVQCTSYSTFFLGYTQAPIYLLHLGYVLTSTYVALMMISQSPKQPTKAEKFHFTNSTFTRLLSPAYPVSMHSSIKRMTQFKLTLNKLYLMDFLQIFSFFCVITWSGPWTCSPLCCNLQSLHSYLTHSASKENTQYV